MLKRYMMNIPMSVNGIGMFLKYAKTIKSNLPYVEKQFTQRSLEFIKERANEYIRETTGNSDWYVLTHQLENSWVIDIVQQTLVNVCRYSAFVEYGTGIVGTGTHPNSENYQYDQGEHGDSGWFFFDDEGILHWTRGMEAHAYLYNAVSDYYNKGEAGRILSEIVEEMMVNAL